MKKCVVCEQGNLFCPSEEHQVIFCPVLSHPLPRIHTPHLASILYASLHKHNAIVTLFTQVVSHNTSLCPFSYVFFFPLPVPTAYSLPPYSNFYSNSTNPITYSNFVPLSVSLFLHPLPPLKSSKSLLHFSLKSTLCPQHSCPAFSLLYSNQGSSCPALPGPARDLQ